MEQVANADFIPIHTNRGHTPDTKKGYQIGSARVGGNSLGKYREIILAVAFFLVFDLAVLILNFYISFQISEDAVSINLSGRQRMLSQRTAKALFALDTAQRQQLPADNEQEELALAVKLFDTSLNGFQRGATVPGGDGKSVALSAATSPAALKSLAETEGIWKTYLIKLQPVLNKTATPEQLAAAVAYARANNVKLLGLMNELTSTLEAEANQRATQLRWVQTGGIILALANFLFILFKFIRRLQASDAAVEAANQENREILSSVREGLFLITPGMQLGTQISRASQRVFGRHLHPNDSFIEVLRPMVPGKTLEDVSEYLKLLFAPHVKEQLVQSLNPLHTLPIHVRNRDGQTQVRHISLEFNRARTGNRISHLLVTAQDVTRIVELEAALEHERGEGRRHQDQLLNALLADPVEVGRFVQRSVDSLLIVNDLLRCMGSLNNGKVLQRQINEIRRRVHAVKGDAGLLNLASLAATAHEFESHLETFSQSGMTSGESLLSLPLPLEQLLEELQTIGTFCQQARRSQVAEPQPGTAALAEQVKKLASHQAEKAGKRVQVHCEFEDEAMRSGHQETIRIIVAQLVRNAIAHGVELPGQRESTGKTAEGEIRLALKRGADDRVTLSVRDDGAGLDPKVIRAKLLSLGWYNPAQLADLDDRQVLMHIFRPGFSTAAGVDSHAGRGVGLDVVHARATALGGALGLGTRPGQYTEFRICFPA